jgi:predicted ATPase
MSNFYISKLKAWNFKSFKHLEIDLDNFNIIIGANSSGKSNLISIFQFIRDIIDNGVENAISLQGGTEYMFNINSKDENMGIEFELKYNPPLTFRYNLNGNRRTKSDGSTSVKSFTYTIEFTVYKKNRKLKKFCERLAINTDGEALNIMNLNGKISTDDQSGYLNNFMNPIVKLLSKRVLTDTSILSMFPLPIIPFFDKSGIPQVFDIDPKLSKHAIPLSGLVDLESDGSNIALVLHNLIKDREKSRKLIGLLNTCMPFIENINVESQLDKSIIINVYERYNNKISLPATFVSDGTIEILALIYILYFEKRKIIAIEEVEKNIHPSLIARVMELIKDSSIAKQIIITTHSPEIIKNADIKNIILIKRDSEGNSFIVRPSTAKDLQIFLQQNIGISELFTDGFLN